jgi:CheY-like chemotaxis protein
MVGDAVATQFSDLIPRPLRILVVDRSRDIAEQYVALLEHFGHRSVSVADGEAAMREVEQQPFDAVIAGLKLGGIDGFNLAARLRAHPHTCAARLVAISGAAGDEVVQRARAAGFDAHHCKPVAVDDILKSLT